MQSLNRGTPMPFSQNRPCQTTCSLFLKASCLIVFYCVFHFSNLAKRKNKILLIDFQNRDVQFWSLKNTIALLNAPLVNYVPIGISNFFFELRKFISEFKKVINGNLGSFHIDDRRAAFIF